jgi:DNA-binding NtrC family response regulator
MPFDDVVAAGALPSFWNGDGHATILLVDDEENVRDMCRRALESDGSTVIGADDGIMALSLIQEWTGRLDLVITDMKMPRLDGLAVAEVLSVFRPNLPVLGMTGDPEMADRRLPTLLKPFSFEELIEAARAMRSRTMETRTWSQEQRARARQMRRVAAAMKARATDLRDRVDLVAVALELQRNGSVAPH